MAVGQVKSVLEQEITCALCLDIFKEPKKLPCNHVFCKDCLDMLARRNVTPAISCPECRRLAQLPNGVVKDLPKAFHVSRLIDAFQKGQEAQEQDDAALVATAEFPSTRQTRQERNNMLDRDDIFRSSQTSEWQRMRAMREREQHATTGRPRNGPGSNGSDSEPAATLSQKIFRNFSQIKTSVKTEWNMIVRGIKQLGRSQSREYRYICLV